MEADLLITNIHIATMSEDTGYGIHQNEGAHDLSALAITKGKIIWLGGHKAAGTINAKKQIDGQQHWLTPGLIDCHTHLVYGGHRAEEFELKLQDEGYEEIARRGGGILSTVNATRRLEAHQLFQGASKRLTNLISEGVTTVEIKSGYGLDLENEIKMLRVAKDLGQHHPVNVVTTYLGAHALPPEFDDKDKYIQFIIDSVLPQVAALELADAVDFFCEGIGFNVQQCERICQAAVGLNLPIKGHVEQLSNLRGAKMVAKYAGLSADHLEYLSADDVPYLKAAGTVAVLLPGAFYSLRETKVPPITAMRVNKIPIAIASDLNPGSSPIASLLNIMNIACIQYRLTPSEVLLGVTKFAAMALGKQASLGQVKVGYHADLVLWPIETPAQLCYGMNLVKPSRIIKDGQCNDTL